MQSPQGRVCWERIWAARGPGREKESNWGRGDGEVLETLVGCSAWAGWMRGSESVLWEKWHDLEGCSHLEDDTRPQETRVGTGGPARIK